MNSDEPNKLCHECLDFSKTICFWEKRRVMFFNKQRNGGKLEEIVAMHYLIAHSKLVSLSILISFGIDFILTPTLNIAAENWSRRVPWISEGELTSEKNLLGSWPFLGRLRVCFAEPPYFQMNIKPIFTHGVDVAVVPGIAGWLDKLLSIAFEQTFVEPNMLVVDMKKFVSPQSGENWFFVDEKEPVAHALVEFVEASDVKPSDLNGLSDPYVKGQLGA
ncbi:unnamed protein product [Eruca vesicaria subsp. sativa]|uniref:Uncharacterized protein n=1 Tax=Eruca vesicaria subsp. sativa TaxID=29727 RepID=A0ABC8J433_ERUVS|nr:unnamed protein product [Eruca vesicaria subsp. sativa]